MSYKSYTYTIPSDEELHFDIPGKGISILEANLATFEVCFDDAGFTEMQRGLTYRPPNGFKSFCIRNGNGVGLNVAFGVFEGDFEDRRFLTNEVQGIVPSTITDIRNAAYLKDAIQTAVVAEKSLCALWNPTGSGKIAAVNALTATTPTADRLTVSVLDDNTNFTLVSNVVSKYFGDPAGVCEIYRYTFATPGTITGDTIDRFRVAANETFSAEYTPPLLIPPGKGVVVWHDSANAELNCAFELLEIDG